MTTTTAPPPPPPVSLTPLELVVTLRDLIADEAAATKNRARVVELLTTHNALAEYEVARSYVRRTLPKGFIAALCASPDPRARRDGCDLVRCTADAAEAA